VASELETLVSVDLDGPGCYHAIHGLSGPDGSASGAVLRRTVPRMLDVLESAGSRATFFVIGRDVEEDRAAGGAGAEVLRRAAALGHELANHGYAHAYDLVRWSREEQLEDLRRCDALLRELGARPEGFRAPGYTHDAHLLAVVRELGYRYDSSALPSPTYWIAKAAAIASLALRGRRSASLLRGVGSFLGPRGPHTRSDAGLVELPMTTSPLLRVPVIGTTLICGPAPLRGWLRGVVGRRPYVHLELHAIDLADAAADGWDPRLVAQRPELRTPVAERAKRLREFLLSRGGGRPCREARALRDPMTPRGP
jgi:hypothetical protein